MKHKFITLVAGLALAAGLFGVLPAAAAPDVSPSVSTTIVISEFRTRGPDGGNDEFIEIFNLSANSIDIGGWKINGSNSSGTTGTRVTISTGVSLGSGCRYLLTNTAAVGGYSGSLPGNQTYSSGIADNGGIAVLNASDAIVDQVGMSSGSAYKEGTTLASTTLNQDQSYERKPAATNTTDTDDNASDFLYNSDSSNPQNSSSGCTPLAVTLAGFTAQAQADRILVAWETVSELDNAGFNVYRADDAVVPQTLLAYVPSQGPGSQQGFSYTYNDLAVQPGQTWWYWLEDVSLSGATTLHGPVSATVQTPTAVQLSSVSASPAAGVAGLPWLVVVAGAGVALALGRRR